MVGTALLSTESGVGAAGGCSVSDMVFLDQELLKIRSALAGCWLLVAGCLAQERGKRWILGLN